MIASVQCVRDQLDFPSYPTNVRIDIERSLYQVLKLVNTQQYDRCVSVRCRLEIDWSQFLLVVDRDERKPGPEKWNHSLHSHLNKRSKSSMGIGSTNEGILCVRESFLQETSTYGNTNEIDLLQQAQPLISYVHGLVGESLDWYSKTIRFLAVL